MRLLYLRSDPSVSGPIDDSRLSALYQHRVPAGYPYWLKTNFVSSLDGSIQGADGRAGSINTPSDQHVFALHRAHADAIVVGAQTARAERYRAVDLAAWQRSIREVEGLAPFPLLVILTRSLDLDPKIARNGDLEVGPVMIVTTTGKSETELEAFEAAGVEVRQQGGGQVDLREAMEQLSAGGYRRLLCEGGSRLHRDLLAADLVDEMSLTLSPIVVAGEGRRTTAGDRLEPVPTFELESALLGDDGALFVNYTRPRP